MRARVRVCVCACQGVSGLSWPRAAAPLPTGRPPAAPPACWWGEWAKGASAYHPVWLRRPAIVKNRRQKRALAGLCVRVAASLMSRATERFGTFQRAFQGDERTPLSTSSSSVVVRMVQKCEVWYTPPHRNATVLIVSTYLLMCATASLTSCDAVLPCSGREERMLRPLAPA